MTVPLRLVAVTVAIGAAATAGHGSLDPSFGRDGTVTKWIGVDGGAAKALVLQPDGKLVAAGQASLTEGNKAFVLVRYGADGSIDPSFGRDETVTMTVGDWGAPALVRQADGKFVALPTSGNAVSRTLVRFNTDGSLDRGFGNRGKANVPLNARALVVQPDDKLVVAGDDGRGFVLVRLNPGGTLDPSFGTGGKVRTARGKYGISILALALQRNGKLVAVGQRTDANVLLRYTRNGKLDPTFGKGGRSSVGRTGIPRGAQGLAIQADGKIVLVGFDTPPRSVLTTYALRRFNRNGTRDASFGRGGEVLTAADSDNVGASAVTIQPDGKIVVVGDAHQQGSDTLGPGSIVRYNPDGTVDRSFGSAGKVTAGLHQRAGEPAGRQARRRRRLARRVHCHALPPLGGRQSGDDHDLVAACRNHERCLHRHSGCGWRSDSVHLDPSFRRLTGRIELERHGCDFRYAHGHRAFHIYRAGRGF